jgi:hypothetical protein
MRASLQAACIGGLVALLTILGLDAGAAPGGADTLAETAAQAPPTAAPTPSPPLSATDLAAAKADPDCQATDVACAWTHCNPLGRQWQSYHSCIVDSCHVEARSCIGDLIMDLNDANRQKTGGRS